LLTLTLSFVAVIAVPLWRGPWHGAAAARRGAGASCRPGARGSYRTAARRLRAVQSGSPGRFHAIGICPSAPLTARRFFAMTRSPGQIRRETKTVPSPITPQGFERLQQELKRLKNEERPAIGRALEEARGHGDLRENAEYHATKDRQGLTEARIRQIEAILGECQVIDPRRQASDRIAFGAQVTVVDLETEKEATYRIVGEHEADLDQGRISIVSPLARALMGKTVGDDVAFATPKGERELEITGITY
jgi:transcription elongation factor GreA